MLGANDGIVSTASLMVGVAAASATQGSIMLTGVAGLVAGAMSMAVGEYVSVHSQADTEAADLARETAELQKDPEAEHRELTAIYVSRGLDVDLAKDVATQLIQHDAIGTHAWDELAYQRHSAHSPFRPHWHLRRALLVPALVTAMKPAGSLIVWIAATSLVFLAALGVLAVRAGGANPLASVWRVTFWGALALGITAGFGKLFGAAV